MKIFTFEGIDGAGKTSTMEAVAERLETDEYPVRTISFPYNESIAIATFHRSVIAQAMGYILDQRIVMDDLARDLADPGILLIDRFYDSTIAYQGGVPGGLNVEHLALAALGYIRIEKTFWLDLPVPIAIERINKRGLSETAYPGYLTLVQGRYEELAKANANRIMRIDATQPLDETVNKVFRVITDRLIKEGL